MDTEIDLKYLFNHATELTKGREEGPGGRRLLKIQDPKKVCQLIASEQTFIQHLVYKLDYCL